MLLGIGLFQLFFYLYGKRHGINDLIRSKKQKVQLKNEGLVSYWEAIKPDPDRQIMIGREVYFQRKYEGFITYTDDQF